MQQWLAPRDVDVVATELYQLARRAADPFSRKFALRNLAAMAFAVDTAQVAAAEEDRARAPGAGQARLLPLVKGHQGDPRIPAGPAKTRLSRQAVDAATARTQGAAPQQ